MTTLSQNKAQLLLAKNTNYITYIITISLFILALTGFTTIKTAAAAEMIYDTPGTYNFVVPDYSTLSVEVWGGGGGGGEDNGTTGAAGVASTFSTVTANGGAGGAGNTTGGTGGNASGGSTNLSGADGTDAMRGYSGDGGDGANGGAGGVRVTSRGSGNDGLAPAGGGSGSFDRGFSFRAGGGGGGAYATQSYTSGDFTPGDVITVTVGAGGTGGNGQTSYTGGNGADGQVAITWEVPQVPVAPDAASNPAPADTATGVSAATDLSWTGDTTATTYNVYVSTDNTLPAGSLVAQDVNTNSVTTTFEASTTYYWRVDAVNAVDTTAGDVWSFTTAEAGVLPTAVSYTTPVDAVTGVPTALTLAWSLNDTANQYEVFLGTTPTLGAGDSVGTQTGSIYEAAGLSANTTYYWRVDAINESGTTEGAVLSFTTQGATGTYTSQTTADIAYGPDAAHTLDVCAPVTGSTNLPAVVLIHGGGWTGGDKSMMQGVCDRFAENGMVAININYRLLDDTVTPAINPYPAQLADPQLAVRWLRANAATYNVNPDAICTFGRSAGAHMSLLLGTVAETAVNDMSSLYPEQSSHVSCVVDEYGPSDLLNLLSTAQDADKWLAMSSYDTLGDAGLIDASPVFKVTADAPAMMIVHGALDTTVVPEHSEFMRDALVAADVPVDYSSFPNASHGLQELKFRERRDLFQSQVTFISSVIGRI